MPPAWLPGLSLSRMGLIEVPGRESPRCIAEFRRLWPGRPILIGAHSKRRVRLITFKLRDYLRARFLPCEHGFSFGRLGIRVLLYNGLHESQHEERNEVIILPAPQDLERENVRMPLLRSNPTSTRRIYGLVQPGSSYTPRQRFYIGQGLATAMAAILLSRYSG